ncbi:MAG: addiction module protein [Terrimicrobiaceae bacterium]
MSSVERLQAMEFLWRSFSSSSDELQSPDWHADVLSRRLAKVEAGQGRFLSVSELKTRLASGRA